MFFSAALSMRWRVLQQAPVEVAHHNSDTDGQDALDVSPVEGGPDGGRSFGSSQVLEEVKMLLCLLGQCGYN